MNLYVDKTTLSEGKSSRKRYGSWWKDSTHTFHGLVSDIGKTTSFGYEMVTTSADAKPGDLLYLLWVEYSTGDSFGTSRGNFCEVGVYDDEEKAKHIASLIRDDCKIKKDEPTILVDMDGVNVSTTTWKGYFERLQDVHIELLELTE